MKKKLKRKHTTPSICFQVVDAHELIELKGKIDEWERFAEHLLVTLAVGKEPMCIEFGNETMHSVMSQLRRYYPQMGITEMINDVRKEGQNEKDA